MLKSKKQLNTDICIKCRWNIINLENNSDDNYCRKGHALDKAACKDFNSLYIKDR